MIRALWCRLRRRHTLCASLSADGTHVVVGCQACRAARLVPLSRPAPGPLRAGALWAEQLAAGEVVLLDRAVHDAHVFEIQARRGLAPLDLTGEQDPGEGGS